LDHLTLNSEFFSQIDENAERKKMGHQMNMFKLLLNVDPYRAYKLMGAKASSVMVAWGDDKVVDHSHTLNQWNDSWKTNK
jgi:hypothetical protein